MIITKISEAVEESFIDCGLCWYEIPKDSARLCMVWHFGFLTRETAIF